MAKKKFYDDYYATMDSRKRRELEDASMLHEDRSAIANMPQQVKMVEYPKANYYRSDSLEDTVRGVDNQMDGDGRDMVKTRKPKLIP